MLGSCLFNLINLACLACSAGLPVACVPYGGVSWVVGDCLDPADVAGSVLHSGERPLVDRLNLPGQCDDSVLMTWKRNEMCVLLRFTHPARPLLERKFVGLREFVDVAEAEDGEEAAGCGVLDLFSVFHVPLDRDQFAA